MGAKLAFPLYHWHFPCRIVSDDCFQSVEPPGMLLPVLQALLCCFSLPTAYRPFQYSAVLQWDFLTIIHPTGVVWKTGCCNTHTKCTITLSWGLRKIALLCLENSSLKLAEAAAELLGYADPDAVTACISHLMSLTSKPLLGALWSCFMLPQPFMQMWPNEFTALTYVLRSSHELELNLALFFPVERCCIEMQNEYIKN